MSWIKVIMTYRFELRHVLQLYIVDNVRLRFPATVELHNCNTCTCDRTYKAPNQLDSRSKCNIETECRLYFDGQPFEQLYVDYPSVGSSEHLNCLWIRS